MVTPFFMLKHVLKNNEPPEITGSIVAQDS
jgi:hypothetical protein